MKTTHTQQHRHCAHVAVYYADQCDKMKTGNFMRDLVPKQLGTLKNWTIGGIKEAVQWQRMALAFALKAAKEWQSAGGAA